MARFETLRGVFGLLPTPYRRDYEIATEALRATAEFCCASGQHGVVWPVMVGELYYLAEQEREKNLDAILETVDGRVPVVSGCSSSSLPETLRLARAADRAGCDAVIAMVPLDATPAMMIEMFHRLAEVFDGPLVVQNHAERATLSSEQLASLVESVPSVEYVKEERVPSPRHIAAVREVVGNRVKTIFGGSGGKLLPEELSRGAGGCMPACQLADVLARVIGLWWQGDEGGARELHRRMLALIIRETHPFMRYVLQCRGVLGLSAERGPAWGHPLDEGERKEIAVLVAELVGELGSFPYRPVV